MLNKITYENVKPIIEALKELGRVAVIAAIPVAIDGLSSGELNLKLVLTSAIIAVLRGLDKFMHLEGKVEGNDLLTGGLTRF